MSESNVISAYATASEADSLLSGRPDVSSWTALSTAQKNTFLQNASRKLDLCIHWSGERAAASQTLQWPRTGAVDASGSDIAENVIPECVKIAAVEEALRECRPEFSAMQKLNASGISGAAVGGMNISSRSGTVDFICLNALTAAENAGVRRPWLKVSGAGPVVRTGTLERG